VPLTLHVKCHPICDKYVVFLLHFFRAHIVHICPCCCCYDEPGTSGNCLYEGTKMSRSSKRWGIPPDSESGGICLSLMIVDSHLLTGAPLKAVVDHSWRFVNHCKTIDVDGCRQTVKLQSVLRLCSGLYRSKDPTNSIKVLKEVNICPLICLGLAIVSDLMSN